MSKNSVSLSNKMNFFISISVENKGLEPLTPCVQGRCSKPTELIPQFFQYIK